MKRICTVLLLAAFLLAPFAAAGYESALYDDYALLTGLSLPAQPASAPAVAASAAAEQAAAALSLTASSAILYERETGAVLFEKAPDARRAVASITKVMTLLLVIEAIEQGKLALTDPVTVSEHAYSMGGSQIWLEPGEVMTVDELLRAVCVQSANDAAVALAEAVSGSEESFVVQMNAKAAALGMTETTFKNSNGLDEEGHLSSARDVALMSDALLHHPLIREYCTIWMDSLRGGATELTNTNKLLKSYSGITGLKTGTTGKAGVCISASAERDGMELIAVVLGCPDSKSRFADARKLLDFGFAYYELAPLALPQESLTPVRVSLGVEERCAYDCALPQALLVEKGGAASVRLEVTLADRVAAPVEAGQELGLVTVYANGEPAARYPICAGAAVARLDFGSGIRKLLGAFLCM